MSTQFFAVEIERDAIKAASELSVGCYIISNAVTTECAQSVGEWSCHDRGIRAAVISGLLRKVTPDDSSHDARSSKIRCSEFCWLFSFQKVVPHNGCFRLD